MLRLHWASPEVRQNVARWRVFTEYGNHRLVHSSGAPKMISDRVREEYGSCGWHRLSFRETCLLLLITRRRTWYLYDRRGTFLWSSRDMMPTTNPENRSPFRCSVPVLDENSRSTIGLSGVTVRLLAHPEIDPERLSKWHEQRPWRPITIHALMGGWLEFLGCWTGAA